MRELNRLNQYQRLWRISEGQPQQCSVAEIAAHCICSERHARTLLNQWQQAGWVAWLGQSGRGKRGALRFLQSPALLREKLMQQQLQNGLPHQALALVQLAPEQLSQLLTPFMGGQWLDDSPTLRIPYYRPLERLTPPDLPGRAEQHLATQIFAGLTRFNGDTVVADLAHHWQCSEDGLSWHFFLRPQLFWHNGERITVHQLLQSLRNLHQSATGKKLLSCVAGFSSPHPLCLRIDLLRPDYWLTHRLASVTCLLPHPELPEVGAGRWRLEHKSLTLVRLDKHDRYQGEQPLMQAIEYWITPQLFDRALGTSCRHPVQIAIGDHHELTALRPVSRRLSLGFCYLAVNQQRLTGSQASKLIGMMRTQKLVAGLPLDEGLITPSEAMLPGWPIPPLCEYGDVVLPAELHLHYHLPVELHVMAEALRDGLAAEGCRLHLHFNDAKNWQDYAVLENADIVMGDRLIGAAPAFTLESWLRLDPLWRGVLGEDAAAALQAHLDEVQQHREESVRLAALKATFQRLMANAIITPLFNYRYQISAPPDVEGIELNAWGWFDFSRAWIPPPLD